VLTYYWILTIHYNSLIILLFVQFGSKAICEYQMFPKDKFYPLRPQIDTSTSAARTEAAFCHPINDVIHQPLVCVGGEAFFRDSLGINCNVEQSSMFRSGATEDMQKLLTFQKVVPFLLEAENGALEVQNRRFEDDADGDISRQDKDCYAVTKPTAQFATLLQQTNAKESGK
jgi:hypothetical protein